MMRLFACLLALALVLCLLDVAPAPAQDDDENWTPPPTIPALGRVMDATGKPIPGATVLGWVDGQPDTRVEATSADDGGYELPPAHYTDQWHMAVRLPDGGHHDLGVIEPYGRQIPGPERDIVVSPIATIRGRIAGEPPHREDVSYLPTWVTLIPLDANGDPPVVTPRVVALATRVEGPNASFCFRGMAPGRYSVVAYVCGYNSIAVRHDVSVRAGETVDEVILSQTSVPELDLRVTLPECRREADAFVSFDLQFPADRVLTRFLQRRFGRSWQCQSYSGWFREDGRCKCRIPAGDYQVIVTSRASQRDQLDAKVDLTIPARGSSVHLDLSDWQPVIVRLPKPPAGCNYLVHSVVLPDHRGAKRDEWDGLFRVGILPPGAYEISANAWFGTIARRVLTVGDEPVMLDWEIEYPPEPPRRREFPSHTFVIRGSSAEPVPGARIAVASRTNNGWPGRGNANDDGVATPPWIASWKEFELVVFTADGRVLLPHSGVGPPYWHWQRPEQSSRTELTGQRTEHGLMVYAFQDLVSGCGADRFTDDVGYSGLRNFDLLQSIGSHAIAGGDLEAAVAWLDSWIKSQGRYSKVELKVLRNGETVTWSALAGDLAIDLGGHAIFLR